jgi:hypothetical protein
MVVSSKIDLIDRSIFFTPISKFDKPVFFGNRRHTSNDRISYRMSGPIILKMLNQGSTMWRRRAAKWSECHTFGSGERFETAWNPVKATGSPVPVQYIYNQGNGCQKERGDCHGGKMMQ